MGQEDWGRDDNGAIDMNKLWGWWGHGGGGKTSSVRGQGGGG